jgi:hypothetical protein
MRRAAAWLREAAHVSTLWVLVAPFVIVTAWGLLVKWLIVTGH